MYGGYFGAAQGVLLMAILGIGVPETLQRLNALKNVLAAHRQRGRRRSCSSLVADVDWKIVALIGVGLGDRRPARRDRRAPAARPACCAWMIVVVGVVALTVFLLG